EHGEVYLFTGDGYYVATLLADTRNNPLWRFPAGTIERGDNIGRVSPNDEHFWPLLCKTSDGNVYLTAGKEHSSILRVGGLENVQRIDLGQFTVTSGDLDGLPSTKTISKVAQTRKSMTVPILSGGAITVNGILTEWPAGAWVTINEALGIEGAIAVDNTYLYAAIRSSKPDILNNAGDDYTLLFATGGGIDICIGALGADPERDEPVQGDVRIFVTR